MKRRIPYHFVWIITIISILFVACEKDIDLNLPAQNRLVIFSNFTPDSIFQLHLSTTRPIDNTQSSFDLYPADASIQLFENGNYVDDFVFQPDPFPASLTPFYSLNKKPDPEAEYSIVATLPGLPDITAKNNIPSPVNIDNFVFIDTFGRSAPDNQDVINYRFDTRLEMNTRNLSTGYLHLKAWRYSIFYEYDYYTGDSTKISFYEPLDFNLPSELQKIDVLHEDGSIVDINRISQSDGIDISFSFLFFRGFEVESPIYLEVRHVSEDYFLFHKTVSEQEVSSFRESFLTTQSVLVHSNIEDGLGYFGGYSVQVDSVSW